MTSEGNLSPTEAFVHAIGQSQGMLRMATGIEAVTSGSNTDVDTGLDEIQFVIATVKDTNQSAGDGAYVTYNHGADGLLDLYAWDDAGSAASNSTNVCWVAFGK